MKKTFDKGVHINIFVDDYNGSLVATINVPLKNYTIPGLSCFYQTSPNYIFAHCLIVLFFV